HEGEDTWIAEHIRREAFIGDVTVEHRPCRDVGQTMVGSLPGFWRPFFRFAAGPLIAPGRRCDLNRGNAIERSHFPGNFDSGHDCRLRVDHRGIRLYGALKYPERHTSSTE